MLGALRSARIFGESSGEGEMYQATAVISIGAEGVSICQETTIGDCE